MVNVVCMLGGRCPHKCWLLNDCALIAHTLKKKAYFETRIKCLILIEPSIFVSFWHNISSTKIAMMMYNSGHIWMRILKNIARVSVFDLVKQYNVLVSCVCVFFIIIIIKNTLMTTGIKSKIF